VKGAEGKNIAKAKAKLNKLFYLTSNIARKTI